MSKIKTGRAGSIIKFYKNENSEEVISVYFDHPIWQMGRNDPVPDMPLDIQIELVNRCNLNCDFCNANTQKRSKSFLEWDVLKRIVDEAAEGGVCYITICGIGEASLHPDLFRFLRYIRDKKVVPKGLRVYNMIPSLLITNGVWSSEQVEECIENPPDLLSVSLSGLKDDELKQRRSPLDPDHLWRNIHRIYNERKILCPVNESISPFIHISTHIYPFEMTERKDDIEKFKKRWFEIGDAIVIKPTMLNTRNKHYSIYTKKMQQEPDENNPLLYTNISETHFERTAPCFETSRRLTVNSDGDVWCGHHFSEDFGPFLGNVKEQTLYEIWHGETMNEFRRHVRSAKFTKMLCKNCGGEIREWHRE